MVYLSVFDYDRASVADVIRDRVRDISSGTCDRSVESADSDDTTSERYFNEERDLERPWLTESDGGSYANAPRSPSAPVKISANLGVTRQTYQTLAFASPNSSSPSSIRHRRSIRPCIRNHTRGNETKFSRISRVYIGKERRDPVKIFRSSNRSEIVQSIRD